MGGQIFAGIQVGSENRIDTFHQSRALNDFIQPGINRLLVSVLLTHASYGLGMAGTDVGTVIRNQVHSLESITDKALKMVLPIVSVATVGELPIRRMALLQGSTVISIGIFFGKISSLAQARYWMMPVSIETVIGNKLPIRDSD